MWRRQRIEAIENGEIMAAKNKNMASAKRRRRNISGGNIGGKKRRAAP